MRYFQLREAVASVSLSHPEGCDCKTCRAARGDADAFASILEEMMEAGAL
jgi:hypothetical protein